MCATWMNLEIVIQSEVWYRKTNIIWCHLHMESKRMVQINLFTEIESHEIERLHMYFWISCKAGRLGNPKTLFLKVNNDWSWGVVSLWRGMCCQTPHSPQYSLFLFWYWVIFWYFLNHWDAASCDNGVGLNKMMPKGIHFSILRTCKYITWQKDFADVIKALGMGRLSSVDPV